MREKVRSLLKNYPQLKKNIRYVYDRLFSSKSVSSHYAKLEGENVEIEAGRLRSSWQSDSLPVKQRELVERQLKDYSQGGTVDVFDVLIDALKTIGSTQRTLLEIGCSSGYYSEVLKIKNMPYDYSGCDYSPAFIELGKRCHPDVKLTVQDATELNYSDNSYDVVVSGCCLLHIPEYDRAISESARVAREYVIFHRTPVVTGIPNQYFRKKAYGVETIEIHFNEDHLLDFFKRYGLDLIKTYTLDANKNPDVLGAWSYNRTYLCRKSVNES